MSPERVDHYRSLLNMHARNADPLLMVRGEDLRALLDCYQWFIEEKPRVRRRARLLEHELAETY